MIPKQWFRARLLLVVAGVLWALPGCTSSKDEPKKVDAENQEVESTTTTGEPQQGDVVAADDPAQPQSPAAPDEASQPSEAQPKPKVAVPLEELEQPVPEAMPQVVMSESHAEMCLVGVGDAMPVATLPSAAGGEESLDEHFGQALSVVVFWTGDNPYAVAELGELATDIEAPFADQGLQVVGINEGNTAEEVRQIAESQGATYPQLLDTDDQLLARVGTDGLPRTYLLDKDGKILWFDIEFSRSSRRELIEAIRYTLTHGASVAQQAP